MKTYTFAVLPGDGIGPEVMEVVLKVLKVTAKSLALIWIIKAQILVVLLSTTMALLFLITKAICKESDAILFGSVGGQNGKIYLQKNNQSALHYCPYVKHFLLR